MKIYDYSKDTRRGKRAGIGGGRGGGANNCKLTEKDVIQLREYRAGNWPYKDLALLFGISEGTASACARGKTFKDVGGPIEATGVWRGDGWSRAGKMNAELACLIREAVLNKGANYKETAEAFGVSRSLVGQVMRGETRW